jgi:hypothetical protein
MNNVLTPGEPGGKSSQKPAGELPDPANCRAKHSGIGTLAICLTPENLTCEYVLKFGDENFCIHQESAKIVERTEAG